MEIATAVGSGWPTMTRVYMISGAVNGTNEAARATAPSGFVMTLKMISELKISGSMRKICIC